MNTDKLVILTDIDRDQTGAVDTGIIRKRCLLDDTLSGGHRKECAGLEVFDRDDRSDLLVCFELEKVNDCRTLRGTSGLRDLISLHTEHAASVREAQEEVMRRRCDDLRDIVLFMCGKAGDSAAATVLVLIGIDRAALHVAEVGQRDHDLLFLDQGLIIDLILIRRSDLCSSVFVVLLLDLEDLILNDLSKESLVVDNVSEVRDPLIKFSCLCLEFLSFETGQTAETHIDDVLSLFVGETESLAQSLFCLVLGTAGTDDLDDLVDIIDRN